MVASKSGSPYRASLPPAPKRLSMSAVGTGPNLFQHDQALNDDEHEHQRDHDSDADSAMDLDLDGSEQGSILSSIYAHHVENGRTYHAYKAGKYFLPNDEPEMDRLDLQHHLTVFTQRQLYLCPAGKQGKPLGRVLDAGTGTGSWAIDLADAHPEISVVGVDLSPIQPSYIPSNVEFFVDDLEEEWTFHTRFDLVYFRMMTGSINDWPKMMAQAYENLNPGGWIELLDPVPQVGCDDGTIPEDAPIVEWCRLLDEASTKQGSPLNSILSCKKQMEDAGFINVEQRELRWPINEWPEAKRDKIIGKFAHANIDEGLHALGLKLFTQVLGWELEDHDSLVDRVRMNLANQDYHGYWPLYVLYGQKPE